MLRHFTNGLLRAGSSSAKQQQIALGCQAIRFQSSTSYPSRDGGFTFEPKDEVLWIKFNRPKKYNAITREMYFDLTDTFRKVNGDKSIKAIVLTGNGDYYSSGNDLSNLTLAMQDEDGPRAGFTKSSKILYDFVDSLINLEKLLIAGVNGPALGISVTTLPLCDYVIASEKATFQTPFTALGQCPEACSSVTVPAIMGRTRASELLLLNMTWDAKRAKEYGFISEVVSQDNFHAHLEKLTKQIVASCYPNSMRVSKSLVLNQSTKKSLMEANKLECDEILELWLGEESLDAVQKFFNRLKK